MIDHVFEVSGISLVDKSIPVTDECCRAAVRSSVG